jgi:hypothetical protein
MGLPESIADDGARRGDPRLRIILTFFLLGPVIGALLAASIEFALLPQEDITRGLDAFGVVATFGYLCALVPAALTGWAMGGLFGRVGGLAAWTASGVLLGGLISGLTCAAVIALFDAGVHGSPHLSSNLTGELTFCILFAGHGAAAGGICAAATGRLRSGTASKKPSRRDPLAALNVGDA